MATETYFYSYEIARYPEGTIVKKCGVFTDEFGPTLAYAAIEDIAKRELHKEYPSQEIDNECKLHILQFNKVS
jgi:hypothetical protein